MPLLAMGFQTCNPLMPDNRIMGNPCRQLQSITGIQGDLIA
jgi:hypothetical protein